MASDIVDELRQLAEHGALASPKLMGRAADEIEALRARLKEREEDDVALIETEDGWVGVRTAPVSSDPSPAEPSFGPVTYTTPVDVIFKKVTVLTSETGVTVRATSLEDLEEWAKAYASVPPDVGGLLEALEEVKTMLLDGQGEEDAVLVIDGALRRASAARDAARAGEE